MKIPTSKAAKLKRYLLNADPFLWNVLEARNKKGRLKEIKKLGFLSGYSEGSNPAYNKVYQDLLVEIGIEGILERIVVPKVRDLIGEEALRDFRRYWEQGRTPEKEYLKKKGLCRFPPMLWYNEKEAKDPARIFLQINVQMDFVERWTVFGGLWFEEIEDLLNEQV